MIVIAFLASIRSESTLRASDRTYLPRSEDETGLLAIVISSEVRANQWTKKELTCVSVNAMDPSRTLVTALRRHDLNVCSSAQWRKEFNCGFEVRLRLVSVDLPHDARIHADIVDYREVNEGSGHFAILMRTGEYWARKVDGQWAIDKYVPSKPASEH